MLLPDAREILELAARAQRRVAGATGPLRVGYVSWLPEQLTASAAVDIRVDEWIMPSHVQIARVLDGGLDAAVAWAGSRDERLDFRLLWPEPLVAVTPAGRSAKTVLGADAARARRRRPHVLASVERLRDRVCRRDRCTDRAHRRRRHCRQCVPQPRCPSQRTRPHVTEAVLRQPAPEPPDAPGRRPTPLWCWSLVTRANDDRDSIAALREHVGDAIRSAVSHAAPAGPIWLPLADPHRAEIRSHSGGVGADAARAARG